MKPSQKSLNAEVDLDLANDTNGTFMHRKSGKLKEVFRGIHLKYQKKGWWRIETGLVVGAVFCGLISGVLSHLNSNAAERQLRELFSTKSVIFISKDLKFGELLDKSKIREGEMLGRNMSENVVTYETLSLVLGKRVAIELKEGDPLLLSSVQGISDISNMAEKIPPGKRLFTLTTDDVSAKKGFIRPNDHVDVLAHLVLPDRGVTTFTLLQDVTLVSVGEASIISDTDTNGAEVSFFVNSKNAEMLAFAQKRGSFSLSLRNPKDIGQRDSSRGIDLNEFLDYEGIVEVSGGGELRVTEKGREILKEKKASH